jgi:5'-3' exonuclease|tara:strand:+ start:21480 stop:22478 length:999 start_codon:yes stop_codon:yes gene_type:complete
MAVFIIDGGFFVGRMEKQKHKSGKTIPWWEKSFTQGLVSKKKYKSAINKIFTREFNYLEYKMSEMGEADEVLVCYDGIFGRRVRGRLYNKYKKQRNGINPKKHKGQDVREVIDKCGFDSMNLKENWRGLYDIHKEADDIMAEQIQLYSQLGKEVIVISEDKDMFQILSWEGNIRLFNLKEEITSEQVIEKLQIYPEQYVDMKCLMGDSSDNIPGLVGVGEANAKKLLQEFGSINFIPNSRYLIYVPKDSKNISLKLKEYREKNNLSLAACMKEYGSYWKPYENEKPTPPQNGLILERLFEDLKIRHLFEVKNYKEEIFLWKKLMKLPLVINP